jgi:Flp pilus assembly protein TadG
MLPRISSSTIDAAQRRGQRGQALVIFVFAAVALIGAAALATDVSWVFVNQQRMQRAADAAALAGAVYLPGDVSTAFSTALDEASRNGFAHGVDGVVITPSTDPSNNRRLVVDIDTEVDTYFARVFCVSDDTCLESIDVWAQGRAEFVQPVPMGSPQNYYGVGHLVDDVTTTTTRSRDTVWDDHAKDRGGDWHKPKDIDDNDNKYAWADRNGDAHAWGDFKDLWDDLKDEVNVTIEGLEVRLSDAYVVGSGPYSGCVVDVQASWDDGNTWSTALSAGPLNTDGRRDYVVGSSASMSPWGPHAWVKDDFDKSDFEVRLTWRDGTFGCHASRTVRVDQLEVRVSYTTSTTSTSLEQIDVVDPRGNVLPPQNFWAAMQSQGAPNIQGDAYMTYYDRRTAGTNDDYDADSHYHYAVEFPAGSSNGEIWLFDPGFCHVDSNKGTGENWNTGGSYGYSPHQPVSAFYDLWDTKNTPYNGSDDVLVRGTGTMFKRLSLRDPALDTHNPISAPDCSGESWHNGWYKLADRLHGNRTYRVHSYSTDPTSPNDQRNTTAMNAYAIWATANGGTPRVHGVGAMQAYVRLPGGRSSEFYLAQIDAEHAGKTMVISLWDPGDTGNLAANLQILRPTASAYVTATFNYSAERGSSHSNTSSCDARSGTNVTSVTTNTGGSSRYNGCWLNIEIPLPSDYDAPNPTSDTVTSEGGWWKIRYNMSGSSSDYSTDMTTWSVELRGSPVHLVIP